MWKSYLLRESQLYIYIYIMGEKHIFDASFAPQNSRPPLRQRPAKRGQLGQRIEGLHGVPFAVADGGGLADNPLG